MSRKDQGYSPTSTPYLLPDSSFTVTPAGFDTGTRKFIVDVAALPNVLPLRGTADTAISYTKGSSTTYKGNYSGMYVDSVSGITEIQNNLAEYTVNYLGLVRPVKPFHLKRGTVTSLVSDTFKVKGRDGTLVDVMSNSRRACRRRP